MNKYGNQNKENKVKPNNFQEDSEETKEKLKRLRCYKGLYVIQKNRWLVFRIEVRKSRHFFGTARLASLDTILVTLSKDTKWIKFDWSW